MLSLFLGVLALACLQTCSVSETGCFNGRLLSVEEAEIGIFVCLSLTVLLVSTTLYVHPRSFIIIGTLDGFVRNAIIDCKGNG